MLLKCSEKKLLKIISLKTFFCNRDNISRTNAYFQYFQHHPDVLWSFLAHMVSRNAGWNMCDLEGPALSRLVDGDKRRKLFFTYERANWLIFQDAYPQLLIYHYSTRLGKPMFHLLKYFHISSFMETEWNRYWRNKDKERLLISLIINEQNVIQRPVIEHPFFKKHVFDTALFFLQDWLHFSCVLFPTLEGRLFGASVNGFKSVSKRIDLGKRLADILFHEDIFPFIFRFAKKISHTGSREDYERFLQQNYKSDTPPLRRIYPVILHPPRPVADWSLSQKLKRKWFSGKVSHRHPIHLTDWYADKREQLQTMAMLKEVFKMGKIKRLGDD